MLSWCAASWRVDVHTYRGGRIEIGAGMGEWKISVKRGRHHQLGQQNSRRHAASSMTPMHVARLELGKDGKQVENSEQWRGLVHSD